MIRMSKEALANMTTTGYVCDCFHFNYLKLNKAFNPAFRFMIHLLSSLSQVSSAQGPMWVAAVRVDYEDIDVTIAARNQ